MGQTEMFEPPAEVIEPQQIASLEWEGGTGRTPYVPDNVSRSPTSNNRIIKQAREDMQMNVDYEPTVRQLAELFCELDSVKMAEFFTHCRELSEAWDHNMGIYSQAIWVKDEMPMGSEGAKFLMDMAAPWFVHTLLYADNNGEQVRA